MFNLFNNLGAFNNSDLIWYLESTSPQITGSHQGSAIAIKLYRQGSDIKSAETYLLTCTHNIRDLDLATQKTYGPVLPTIQAWQPNTGYNPSSGINVQIVKEIKPDEDFDPSLPVPTNRRKSAASDWVILKILNPDIREACIPSISIGSKPKKQIEIYGFSGGSKSFDRQIVHPIKLPAPISYKGIYNGTITLISKQGKPGLSGGGVFNKNTNELIGIHRSKQDITETLKAISTKHVLDKIEAQGYKCITNQYSIRKNITNILVILGIILSILTLIVTITPHSNENTNGVVTTHAQRVDCKAEKDKVHFKSMMADKKLDSLRSSIDEFIHYCPEYSYSNYYYGLYFLSINDSISAIDFLKKALTYGVKEKISNEHIIEYQLDLADAYLLQKEWSMALDIYYKISTKSEKNRINYLIGKALFSRSQEEMNPFFSKKSISLFNDVIKVNDLDFSEKSKLYLLVANLINATPTEKTSITSKIKSLLSQSEELCNEIMINPIPPSLGEKHFTARKILLLYTSITPAYCGSGI